MSELAELGITKQSVDEMIRRHPWAWVACEREHVVGFAMIDNDSGSLFAIFVLPSHEGKGIGKLLLSSAEEALFAVHQVIWLETAVHSRANSFYQKQGWKVVEQIAGGDVRLEKQKPLRSS